MILNGKVTASLPVGGDLTDDQSTPVNLHDDEHCVPRGGGPLLTRCVLDASGVLHMTGSENLCFHLGPTGICPPCISDVAPISTFRSHLEKQICKELSAINCCLLDVKSTGSWKNQDPRCFDLIARWQCVLESKTAVIGTGGVWAIWCPPVGHRLARKHILLIRDMYMIP